MSANVTEYNSTHSVAHSPTSSSRNRRRPKPEVTWWRFSTIIFHSPVGRLSYFKKKLKFFESMTLYLEVYCSQCLVSSDRKSRDAASQCLQATSTGARGVIGQRAATLHRLARGRWLASHRHIATFRRYASNRLTFLISHCVIYYLSPDTGERASP